MIFMMICVGSSCHLKGSHEIVEMAEQAIADNKLTDEVVLSGMFCTGKCNRNGVTVKIDDTLYPGITPENFRDFFREHVLDPLGIKEGGN